jgi:hypothetical protein
MKLECIYGVLFVVTLGNVATLDTLMKSQRFVEGKVFLD